MCDYDPKGNRELFRKWIKTYHPVLLLLHSERSSGSCQDLDIEGSVVVYMDRPYWIEFLDKRMRTLRDKYCKRIYLLYSNHCK